MRINDQIIDIEQLDARDEIISGQVAQMKFVGSSAEEHLSKLWSAKFRKYLEADAIFDECRFHISTTVNDEDFYDVLQEGLDEALQYVMVCRKA